MSDTGEGRALAALAGRDPATLTKHQRRMLAAAAQRKVEEREALRELASRELAATNFPDFVRWMWPVLHPATPLVWGRHMDVVCAAIDAQLRGNPEYRNLMLLIPPGFNKSIMASVMRPAWVWLHWASRSSTYVSSMEDLAERDSRKTRLLLQSEEYKVLQQQLAAMGRPPCPVCGLRVHPVWTFAEDQNVKINFENSRRGVRQCIGIKSQATGKRGDDILFDDILDAREVREASAPRLKELLDAVDSQASYFESTRVNDLKTVTRTLIMQRLCEGDPAARRIAEGGWKVICLPVQFDAEHPERCPEDWRSRPGEWLHEARFGVEEKAFVKRKLGEEEYATQYEMRARPKDGTIVRQPWVERYYLEEPEAVKRTADEVAIVIDSAVKGEASNDAVSMACWARRGRQKYVIELVNERMGWLELKRRSRQFIRAHPEARVKVVEDKASGSQLAEELRSVDGDWPGCSGVVLFNPGVKDKMTRFKMWAVPALEAGDVLLPPPERAPWVRGYQARMVGLRPRGTEDDDADTTAMILHRWSDEGRAGPVVERVAGRPLMQAGSVTRWGVREVGSRYRMGVCADWGLSASTAAWGVVVDADTGLQVAEVVVVECGEGAVIVAMAEEAAYWGAVVRLGSVRPGMAVRVGKELAKRRVRVAGREGKFLASDGEKSVWDAKAAPKLWGELEGATRRRAVVVRSAGLENEVAAGDVDAGMGTAVMALTLAVVGGADKTVRPAGGPRLVLMSKGKGGDAWTQTAVAAKG